MTEFNKGNKITFENGKLNIPNNPIIPFIEGDGIGPDIWSASQFVFDAAVKKAFSGKKTTTTTKKRSNKKSTSSRINKKKSNENNKSSVNTSTRMKRNRLANKNATKSTGTSRKAKSTTTMMYELL